MKLFTVLLISSLLLASCATGPRKLTRQFDDYHNQKYADNAIGTAILTDVIPVYTLMGFGALLVDGLILNPLQFWGTDVWSNKGQAFIHKVPTVHEGGTTTSGLSQLEE